MALISETTGEFSPVQRYEVKFDQIEPIRRNGIVNGSVGNSRCVTEIFEIFLTRRWISKLVSFLKRVFLPRGYPQSVSKEYLEYQFWDTLQDFVNAIFMTWVTEATLKAVGVGNVTSTALASTVTMLLADGAGKLAKIGCLWIKGDVFHQNNKKWRLVADFLCDVRILIQILTPIFPKWTIPFVFCFVGIMTVGVEVAAKTTKTITVHQFALQNNAVDVQDKEWIQTTVTRLVALVVSIFLLRVFDDGIGTILTVYGIYVCIHLYGNHRLVRVLQMKEFNEERLLISIKQFLLNGTVPTVPEVNASESVVLGFGISGKDICGYSIKLGVPFRNTLIGLQKILPDLDFHAVLSDLNKNSFIILLNPEAKLVSVIFREGITPIQIIEAYFRAVMTTLTLDCETSALVGVGMDSQTTQNWHNFFEAVKENGFLIEKSLLKSMDFRVQWKSE